MIIKETRPDGFEALAVTCKHIHELASRYIAEHTARKRTYTHKTIDHYYVKKRYWRAKLLYDIWNHPVIASYVKSICFEQTFDDDNQFSKKRQLSQSLIKQCNGGLDFLEISPYCNSKNAGVRLEDWHSKILQGWRVPLEFLVLILLPNLQTLTAYECPGKYERQFHSTIMDRIVWNAIDRRPHALSNLCEVTLFQFDIQSFIPFLALPTVRKIIVDGLFDREIQGSWSWNQLTPPEEIVWPTQYSRLKHQLWSLRHADYRTVSIPGGYTTTSRE